jgi:phosphatidylglycerol:prolipoprotein diacylglycerol transferase
MFPEFFRVGMFALRAWGVMLTLSFFLGLWLLKYEARALRLDYERLFNLGFLVSLIGVVGARLSYVLLHLGDFTAEPLDIINPMAVEGQFGIAGMNLYGGVVLAVVVGMGYLHRRKLSIFDYSDAVVVVVAFGIFLARVGCFLNGCCYGTPTESFLGIVFPPDSPAGAMYPHIHIHPAQLYTSAFGLLLFFLLRRVNRRREFPGQTMALFFMAEAAFRFLVEFIRYYEPEMLLAGGAFTYNQLIAVGLFIFGVAIYILRKRTGMAVQPPARAAK